MQAASSTFSGRAGRALLALCWTGGLLLGIGAYLWAEGGGFSGMHSLAFCPVSIVSLLFSTFLPFLITAIAVMLAPWMLFPVCFCKAFLFSYVAMGICRTFGEGGWLHLGLAMFARLAMLPLLYHLWLKLLGGRGRGAGWLAAACFALLAVFLDCHFASPLWRKLIIISLRKDL